MSGFSGFPDGKQPYTPVPNLFFTEALPDIDHLGELKLTLHIFWLLVQKGKRGEERLFVSIEELAADQRFLAGLVSSEPYADWATPKEALRDALERAVARQTLLRVTAGHGESLRDWYFLNSENGRQAVEDLLAGRWAPSESDGPVRLEAKRPNIFVLYEQNIGALTPMMAEELMEAEGTYEASWIEEAFRRAVKADVRKWTYVRAILERWKKEGIGDEASRGAAERDRRRFIEGEYAEFIEH